MTQAPKMADLQNSLSISSDLSWSSESDLGKSDFSSPEEELLYYARNGCTSDVQNLLQLCADENISINVNCKGNKKSNRGWTPLHLAAYFGHTAVVRTLLEAGADVNMINSAGDTPLHRASYTGREEVVALLLEYGADITVVNSEGHRPRNIARREHIIKMLEAAASHEVRLLNDQLLHAAATGNMDLLRSVTSKKSGPSMECKDDYGNTALHHAALRGHAEVAVYLLQNGVDPNIRNKKGHSASDVANTPHMRQVLGVQPIKTLKLHPQRFEGPLAKKSRFVGFKNLWVVLERGVLSYFQTRGDASTGCKRKGMKYLDEARLWVSEATPLEIRIYFSDGVVHTVALEASNDAHLHRQKWLNALNEHIAFSTHYTHQGEKLEDEDEQLEPLGTMQDSLQTAQAHQKILEKQIQMLKNTVDTLEHFILRPVAKPTHHKSAYVHSQEHEYLRSIHVQASELLKSSRDMCSSLSHCMMLFNQQEQVRQVQVKEQMEKCRVLQDSLHALATEHHELERSLQRRPSMRSLHDQDEFFDCDDDSYGSHVPERFVDALSQDIVFEDAIPTDGSSSLFLQNGEGVRTHLPVPMFSRSDFSVWSILKQCIGKELSKITMPVIFNEPLSFLQRITEYLEYAQLLQTAGRTDDPLLRMQYVAAFAVSAISSNWERVGKPFNPLLGETYELERHDIGFRVVSEQVSHHPPVSAFHAEGEGFSLNGSVLPKLRFWGKSVEITPKGTISLSLPKYNEVYTWQNVNCCIHNVIVGKLWVEHSGTMEIVNHENKLKTVLNFKQCGWFGKDLHRVEGFIYGHKKQKLKALYGNWVLGLYAADPEEYEIAQKPSSKGPSPSNSFSKNGTSSGAEDIEDAQPTNPIVGYSLGVPSQECVWKALPRPSHSSKYFCFTSFAMTLNQLMDGQSSVLAPTDSRIRPDIRLLEEGNIDGAAEEKNRLEEKQRAARKDRKKSKEEWTPVWFTQGTNPHTGSDDWIYTGCYFNRGWSSCPDIF